jgi:malate dehydrogenase (oxaloacetate-decarboxylating)(NADP+)
MAFSAGSHSRILHAVSVLMQDDKIEPILIGKKVSIHKKMDKLRLEHLKDLRIVDPEKCEFFEEFVTKFYQEKKRDGISLSHAEELMKQPNYFGPMLARENKVDSFLAGPNQSYPECFVPMMKVLGPEKGKKSAGVYVLNFKSRIIFFSDCTAQINPTSDDLAHIAVETTKLYRGIMKKEPRVAFLSFSNFGSSSHEAAKKVKRAVEITRKLEPKMIVEGELQADVALNRSLQDMLFDFCELKGPADILIFPDLSSANISYKLLSQLSDASAIGPIIVPMNKAANIIQRTANLDEIINMTSITAFLSTLNK